jgi:hypothetical protein
MGHAENENRNAYHLIDPREICVRNLNARGLPLCPAPRWSPLSPFFIPHFNSFYNPLYRTYVIPGFLSCVTPAHIIIVLFFCNPITGLDRPLGLQEVEAPTFQDNRYMKVVRLSALHIGRLYPPGNIPGTHFCWRLSRPQGHSATGRIMSMKNSNDNIGNRTRDLPVCSAVPQPTAPPRAPLLYYNRI